MTSATTPVIGILGGSGLYQIDGLVDVVWKRVASPFGEASDELCFGTLGGTRVVFLPRHGRGHKLPPTEINFRANIDALKRSGGTEIVSLSAVGRPRQDPAPRVPYPTRVRAGEEGAVAGGDIPALAGARGRRPAAPDLCPDGAGTIGQ